MKKAKDLGATAMMISGVSNSDAASRTTVGAGYARGLVDLAVRLGADRTALLARCGIAPEDLADQDNRVPMANYVALMRTAKMMTGEPALALLYGQSIDLSELSVVGLIARASETMLEAFHQINRYGKLVIEVEGLGFEDRFQLHPDGAGGLWLVDTRKNPNDFPELTESTFARMICNSNEFDDASRSYIKAVHVTHAAPAHEAAYVRILRRPITFNADKNAIQLAAGWANLRVARASRYVFGIFSERAERLLADLESTLTVRGQVERHMIPLLHTGELCIDLIAGKMALSRQTLYRKLKTEGVTFETVLDELRCRMALHYLDGQKVSVNETAYLVGFSDPSAFSRAFKRWTGSSPKHRSAA
jgi:AraC-like DNA-binding protein